MLLIIDDDSGVRSSLRFMLKRAGSSSFGSSFSDPDGYEFYTFHFR